MRAVGAVDLVIALLAACSSARIAATDGGAPDAFVRSNDGGIGDRGNPVPPACPGGGLGCYVPRGCGTTLSGTVYDPAGHNALYNAIVFVPDDPLGALSPMTQGATTSNPCDLSIGAPVAVTTTDQSGHFTLSGVPATTHVPLVVQTGKWRREVFLAPITACADNPVPASLTRLPRNQGEGDLPQMAVLTGQCDAVSCFVRNVGLDATEFTGPDGGGRLHVYRGAGPGPDLGGGGAGAAGDCAGTSGACPLWTTRQELERYDIVLLGCECGPHDETKPDKTPMHDWINEGGKVIAIHEQSTWLKNGPPDFQAVANWVNGPSAGASGPFQIDTSFSKGQILRDWLAAVGALNPDDTIPLNPADVSTSVSTVNVPATRWIFDSSPSPASVKYFSFLTHGIATDAGSVGEKYFGRVTFADVHVGSGGSVSSAPVPASCSGGELTAEGKALEFQFFNWVHCQSRPQPPPFLPPPEIDAGAPDATTVDGGAAMDAPTSD
jgi:hypothetical protein